jgi:hypothetical protein|tara:strand:+ start:739 stop:969 length:231 start_codon:yes stop_codon:yes gene_type:complete
MISLRYLKTFCFLQRFLTQLTKHLARILYLMLFGQHVETAIPFPVMNFFIQHLETAHMSSLRSVAVGEKIWTVRYY